MLAGTLLKRSRFANSFHDSIQISFGVSAYAQSLILFMVCKVQYYLSFSFWFYFYFFFYFYFIYLFIISFFFFLNVWSYIVFHGTHLMRKWRNRKKKDKRFLNSYSQSEPFFNNLNKTPSKTPNQQKKNKKKQKTKKRLFK